MGMVISNGKWTLKMTKTRWILLAIVFFGVLLAVFRLATGLGFSTNLSDDWPWGLWIILDLSAVALAGAGYSMAVLVHILRIKDFAPLARRGLLISLLLYIFVLLTLILEIGRWDNFYRPLISWGYHSPMFEVYVAIMIYMVIQALEFGEVVTEKTLQPLHKPIKAVLPLVFFLGALVPFGHQASLGAIYLLFPDKLNPLWYSPNLPWFFLITSFFVGPAMVLLDTVRSSKVHNYKLDTKALVRLARVAGGIMIGYFIWKMYDLYSLGAIKGMFAGGFEGNMFLVEMALGVLLPAIICFSPFINSKSGMVTFSLLCIFGVILSRFNVVFTGMYQALGPSYAPNFVEWGISIGLFALVLLAYLIIVENFNIYRYHEKPKENYDQPVSHFREVPSFEGK